MTTHVRLRLANVELVSSNLDDHRRRIEVDPFVRVHLTTTAGAGRVLDLDDAEAVDLIADLADVVRRRRVTLAARARTAAIARAQRAEL